MSIEQQEGNSMTDAELQGLFTNVVDEIQRRLEGKQLDAGEKAAIAWVVGKEAPSQEGLLKENPLRQVNTLFGTSSADAKATAWMIHERVRLLVEPEMNRREASGEDVTVSKMLWNADHNQAAEMYDKKGTIPSLGFVPQEWVPPALQPAVQATMLG